MQYVLLLLPSTTTITYYYSYQYLVLVFLLAISISISYQWWYQYQYLVAVLLLLTFVQVYIALYFLPSTTSYQLLASRLIFRHSYSYSQLTLLISNQGLSFSRSNRSTMIQPWLCHVPCAMCHVPCAMCHVVSTYTNTININSTYHHYILYDISSSRISIRYQQCLALGSQRS